MLALPMFAEMTEAQQDCVCAAVRGFFAMQPSIRPPPK
jgi:dTDP-4-amino-4,6-dideoxygalactose transaminase